MKTDLYTKTILTVIAVCLSVNLFQQVDIIPKAYASEKVNPSSDAKFQLVPINESNTIDVRLVDIYTSDELNVNIKSIDSYDEMKVNLKSIDTQDELDINIDEVGGNWVSSGGPLKVKIEQ